MQKTGAWPEDFQRCADFHGHVCPGLAVGYAAVKAANRVLGINRASDEELVAVVENDSCAVDAVQVLLGCTFGKGNLIFRDWGKQVFTFMDRKSGRSVRVAFTGEIPNHEERRSLREKIDAGSADETDKARYRDLKRQAVPALIADSSRDFFEITEVSATIPPTTSIVTTQPCRYCRELTVTSRLLERNNGLVCQDCAARLDKKDV